MSEALPFDLLSQEALARLEGNPRVLVRFLQGYLPYTKGDIAGFTPDYAERLIAAKVAEAVAPDDGPADPTAGAEAAAKPGGKGRTPKPSGGAASGDANDL